MRKSGSHPNAALYCDLMEYIKWRIEAVAKTAGLVAEGQYYLENRMAAEFCLLQLRFCCELLAIGCVAIHTDIPQNKKLREHWNAEWIMATFSKLKPDFFPEPVTSKLEEDGKYQQFPVKDALTKDELLSKYSFFGRFLHTGEYVKYKNRKKEIYDFQLIAKFVHKFRNLLNEHIYFLHDKKMMIRVIMYNEKDGRVWLNELKGVPISGGEP